MSRNGEYKLDGNYGVPMQEALTCDQCEKMRLFLQVLSTIDRKHRDKGPIKVGKFLTEWRKQNIQRILWGEKGWLEKGAG